MLKILIPFLVLLLVLKVGQTQTIYKSPKNSFELTFAGMINDTTFRVDSSKCDTPMYLPITAKHLEIYDGNRIDSRYLIKNITRESLMLQEM